jgi:hypothetical protein
MEMAYFNLTKEAYEVLEDLYFKRPPRHSANDEGVARAIARHNKVVNDGQGSYQYHRMYCSDFCMLPGHLIIVVDDEGGLSLKKIWETERPSHKWEFEFAKASVLANALENTGKRTF